MSESEREPCEVRPEIIFNPKIVRTCVDGQNITVLRLNGAGELMPAELTRIIESIRYSIDHDHVKSIEIPGDVLKQALFGNEEGEFPEDKLIEAIVKPKTLYKDRINAKIVDFYMNGRVFKAAVVDTKGVCIFYDCPETPVAA